MEVSCHGQQQKPSCTYVLGRQLVSMQKRITEIVYSEIQYFRQFFLGNYVFRPWEFIVQRLMLFKKHGLLLGINWIFKDLSPSLVSLHPIEVKQTWQVSFLCLLSDGDWKQQKSMCMYFHSLSSEKPPAKSV